MNVDLKPELERLIEAEIKAGRASGTDEFLNRAIYHYVVARDLGQEYSSEEIDRMIGEGLDEIDRGDTIGGDEALRQLRAHSLERHRKRA